MNHYPTGPSSQDVSDMQRLIDVMNGKSDDVPMHHPVAAPATTHVPATDTHAMKKILESFYGAAGDAITEMVDSSAYDPRLNEALNTKRTDEGAIIGSWEVRVHLVESSGSTRKVYDVLHPGSKSVLFNKLVIFEAAHAIVRYLNKGLAPDHVKIVEIADLEEMYRRNRQDAVIFKKRFERCLELKEEAAAEVFEARHQKARAQAIAANDSIKTILDNIR